MAFADDAAAIRDNLAAELRAETAYRAAHGPKPSYSVGGKSVSWGEYLSTMQATIEKWHQLALQAGGDGGLEEYRTQGWT